jgi:tRNA(Ile)-lysidine synthase
LRLLGRVLAAVGDEGPVELGKLEAFKSALDGAKNGAKKRFRRTLAGAIVTLDGPQIVAERAPARRRKLLTKRRPRRAGKRKTR